MAVTEPGQDLMTTSALEEFLGQADAWLAERYPKAARDSRFVWGEGDDEVRVFAEPDPELEAAAQARADEPPGPEIALNMLALSANMKRLAEFVAAVLGPALVADTGAWGTYAWTSVVLGAPGYRLGGGTDEVLKNAIAQRVLGLPRPA
jgi:hypothetical protein